MLTHFRDNLALYQLIAGLAVVTLILIGCIVILVPFFPAMLLSVIFALSTWPAFAWLHQKLNRRTSLAAGIMTAMLALCFIVPLVTIGSSVADNYEHIYGTLQESLKGDPQVMADKLHSLPVVGSISEKYWLVAMSNREKISVWLQDYSGETMATLLKLGKTLGAGMLDVTLGVLIAYFLFRYGAVTADRMAALIEKFGGEGGNRLLNICKDTLIAVVYGLLGTALAQGAFAAIGFWIAGVPGAPFLGLMTFFLSLIPVGPPLIWIPAALWLLSSGKIFWGIFIIVWGVLVISMIDNIVKPYFISRGSNLPLLLVLLGIMGGAIAFGFIGLFIGPTLLALAYSLVLEWSTVKKAVENVM